MAETSHEVTIFAEPIFEIDGFHITNSLLNTWLVVFAVIIFGLAFRRAIGVIPRKAQNILEMIVEQLLGVFDSVTCPGTEGELTVLKNHALFVTALKSGEITIKKGEAVYGKVLPCRNTQTHKPSVF